MKKIASFILVLAFAFALVACGNVTETTQLGTSAYSIVLPEGFVLSEDEPAEDQVAYYYKDDNTVDFDVYQWEKGDQYTLESEANNYAAEYGTTAEAVVVNGINGMKYISIEDYEGVTYTVINYMFEDDVYLVELCFWTLESEAEYATIDEILGTLKKN